MKSSKKIGLFLSSFIPLFLLVITKELVEIINNNWSLNFLNLSIIISLSIFAMYGFLSVKYVYKSILTTKSKKIKIVNKNNLTDQHFLGYFSLFVLFAVTFEIEMYSMAIIFFIVLMLIGRVYIKNEMYYINPFVNLFGYSFYDIEFKENDGKLKKARVFYKGQLKIGESYLMHHSFYSFIFLKNKEN